MQAIHDELPVVASGPDGSGFDEDAKAQPQIADYQVDVGELLGYAIPGH